MQLWHRLSLEQKTITLLAAFFLLFSVNTLVINILQKNTSANTHIIATVQKLTTEAEQALENLQIRNQQAERQVLNYDNLLNSLRNGGILPDAKAEVSPAQGEEKFYLENIYQDWVNLSSSVEFIFSNSHIKDTVIQHVGQVSVNNTEPRVMPKVQQVNNGVIREYGRIELLLPEWKEANREYISFLLTRNQEQQAAVSRVSMIFWALLIIGLSIVLFKVRKEVFNPLREVIFAGDKISRGHYTIRVKENYRNELGRIGEILNTTADTLQNSASRLQALQNGKSEETGEVATVEEENTITTAINNMQLHLSRIGQEEKERIWVSEGLAKFGDLLRTHSGSLEILSDQITAALVKYTGSLVGGFYLLSGEDEQKELKLAALYALAKKKYQQRTYKPGEGLVGQAYLEEDYIYMLEIPENYISVTSGIGETSPKAILLVPLKVENEVFGVIELASLREYHKYEVEFVRKLGENIASTIKNVKVSENTRLLLVESQEMGEEMRCHEEEMRQNMEELSATQEEMARNEQVFLTRLDAINNTMALAEYDAGKRIIYNNTKFAQLHEYSQTDLKGTLMTSFVNADGLGELEELWSRLKNGGVQQGIFKRITKQGSAVVVRATFTPELNENGGLIKVVELSEVSEEGNERSASRISEVEEMLWFQMKALDVTEQELVRQKKSIVQINDIFQGQVFHLLASKQGEVKYQDEKLHEAIGKHVQSILEFQEIETDFFKKDHTAGKINYQNELFRYIMKKIDDDSYLFLLAII